MRIVSIKSLKPGMTLGKTIIGNSGQILLKQGILLTSGYIRFLRKYPLEAVYISTGRDVIVEDVISDETRLKAIAKTQDVLTKVKSGAELKTPGISEILVTLIDELLLQDDIMINLVDLRSFDEDLFSHSVNVAVTALILGMEYKYNMEHLRNLALASLLHDIGRALLKEQNDMEHVNLGVNLLKKNKLKKVIIDTVSQHHERWDGNGYPNRLQGNEISEYARIIQVANVFDRLSANNRYPMEEVVEYLMGKSGEEFDPKAVKRFMGCVSFYPVGTIVELNSKEVGVVIKANKGFPTRPAVRIEENIHGDKIENGYVVDLMEKRTLFVTKRLDRSLT